MQAVAVDEIKAVAPFELPPLPYSQNALEPFISERTISFHYEKHHKKYVTTTNDLIKGTKFEKSNLEQIIKGTAGNADFKKLFNNASQAWNHWFYWNCIVPGGGGPKGKVLHAIESSFGGFEAFSKELSGAAVSQFGSGYAWVVLDKDAIKVMQSANGDNPVAHNLKPLFCIDVWEHAYYLDYQNKREEYVSAVVNNLINWDFFERNLSGE
jgi:Fe-Mn family superoxide dismutase